MGELAIATSTYVPAAYYQPSKDEPYRNWAGTKTSEFVVKVDLPIKRAVASSSNDVRSKFSTELSATMSALNRLRTFKTWKENWDAEGAPAPDSDSIEAATQVLSLLALENVAPTVTLNSDGKPMLLINQWGLDGEITVTEPGEVEFFFDADEPLGDVVPFTGHALPEVLVNVFAAART